MDTYTHLCVFPGRTEYKASEPCFPFALLTFSFILISFYLSFAVTFPPQIPLPSSPTQVMDRLIEFAYTASISVGEKCVIHVMNVAVMYQIDSVVRACCDFLVQQLDPSNAIGFASFAEQIGCTELYQKAREYIYMNFSQVIIIICNESSTGLYLIITCICSTHNWKNEIHYL